MPIFWGVYVVGFLKQCIYVRLLVLSCIIQALLPGQEKALEQLQHAQKENKWCGSHNQMWIAMLMSPDWAK